MKSGIPKYNATYTSISLVKYRLLRFFFFTFANECDSKTASEGHWVIKTSSHNEKSWPGCPASTLPARVLQLADRNGNATFEPPINHRRRRSDLRRLDEPCREYISVDVYPDTGVSEKRPTPSGSAWLLQPSCKLNCHPQRVAEEDDVRGS